MSVAACKFMREKEKSTFKIEHHALRPSFSCARRRLEVGVVASLVSALYRFPAQQQAERQPCGTFHHHCRQTAVLPCSCPALWRISYLVSQLVR